MFFMLCKDMDEMANTGLIKALLWIRCQLVDTLNTRSALTKLLPKPGKDVLFMGHHVSEPYRLVTKLQFCEEGLPVEAKTSLLFSTVLVNGPRLK
jgi:hypothetical protein